MGVLRKLLLIFTLFLIANKVFALPFAITPVGTLPTTVIDGLTSSASYTVQNNTTLQRNNTYVKYLPPNVTIAAGGCGSTFNLAPKGQAGDSCTLNLTISGPVDSSDPDPSHHLFICFPGGKACAGPPSQLNVSTIYLTSIAVTPETPTVAAGYTQQFTATGTYTDGSTFDLSSLASWSSSDTSVATINSSGLATTLILGTTNITATYGSFVSTPIAFAVTAAELVSIAVTPTTATVLPGNTQQYTATGTYSDSSTADLTSSSTWASGTTATATINSSGLATTIAAGTTDITAVNTEITSNTATLTVPALTAIAITPTSSTILDTTTQQFTAIGTYGSSGSQDISSTVTWGSSSTGVATINSGGLATSVSGGSTNITATLSSVTSNTAVLDVIGALIAAGYYTNVNAKPACYTSSTGNIWAVSGTQPAEQGVGAANNLSSVACGKNADKCVTVGNYDLAPMTFYSTNFGASWTVSLPTPINANNHDLNGISCDLTGVNCFTAGVYDDGSINQPLVYRSSDTGTSWSNVSPTAALTTRTLYSIACDVSTTVINSTRCITVGFYLDGNDKPLAYYSTDGGQNWTEQSPTSDANNRILYGISCDSTATNCTAVGTLDSTGLIPLSYYSTDGGVTWQASTTQPPQVGNKPNTLLSVSCDTASTNCTAVGNYTNASPNKTYPLAYYSTNGGTTWTTATTQPPTVNVNYDHVLSSVKCYPSTTYCVAVGNANTGSAVLPISYYSIDRGVNWTVSATMPPVISSSTANVTNGAG